MNKGFTYKSLMRQLHRHCDRRWKRGGQVVIVQQERLAKAMGSHLQTPIGDGRVRRDEQKH